MRTTDWTRLDRWAERLTLIAIASFLLAYFSFTNSLKDAVQPLLLNLAVILAVIVSGLRFSVGQPLRLPAGWCWLAAAALAFWSLRSVKIWAERPAFSQLEAYQQLEVFFLFLLMPQLVPDRRRLGQLAGAVLIVSTLLACLAIGARVLGGGNHSQLGFAYPTGNPNLTTLILEPGLLLSLGGVCYLRVRQSDLPAVLAGCSLLIHLLARGISSSMGGMIAVAAGVVLMACLLLRGWLQRLSVATGLVGLVLLVAVFARPPEVARRSIGLRKVLWRQAWGLYISSPRTMALGCGLGNYLPASIPFRVDNYYSQPEQAATSPHPHNLLLRTAAELGGVGVLLLLIWLLTLYDRGLTLVASGERDLKYYGAISLAVLTSLLVHAQVTWFLLHPLGLFLFWGWAGVLAAGVEQCPEREAPRVGLGLVFCTFPVLLLSTAYWIFVVTPFMGHLDTRQGKRLMAEARRTPGPGARQEQFRLAADYLGRGLDRLTPKRSESFGSLLARERLGMALHNSSRLGQAKLVWQDLENRCPGFGDVQFHLARVSLALRQPQEANRYYLDYFQRNPVEPRAYATWWRHQDELGRNPIVVDQVIGHLQRGVSLAPAGPRKAALIDLQRRFEVLLRN